MSRRRQFVAHLSMCHRWWIYYSLVYVRDAKYQGGVSRELRKGLQLLMMKSRGSMCFVPLILLLSMCKGSFSLPNYGGDNWSMDKLRTAIKSEPDIVRQEFKHVVDRIQKLRKEGGDLNWISDIGSDPEFLKGYRFKDQQLQYDPDEFRDMTELIRSQGYPVEKFVVETKDGFLLDVHRIPHGRKDVPSNKIRPVVFLQHALLSSGADWVINLANGSLGFILADHGYDVWLGNSRGNTYSRRHISLKPDDDRFWDWSFDEMAKYDTPAFIDYILKVTKQPSLYYVGHSQGTMMAFALFFSMPEYQKKVRLFVGLAPIISLNYIESPIKYFSLMSDELIYLIFGRKDFFPNNFFMKWVAGDICDDAKTKWICNDIVFLLCGYDSQHLNQSRLPVYISHTPAGASVKDMVHFSQMIKERRFSMYDFGSDAENMKHYNQTNPPGYDASKVKVPSLLFTGPNDTLADPKDVATLMSTLPNVVRRYDIPEWNHMDFVWGTNAPSQCYSKILEWLPKY